MEDEDLMQKFYGKVAVVTGAAGGIGADICKELVRHGMIVCAFSPKVDKVERIRATLFDVPGQLRPVNCDIRDEDAVKGSFDWINRTYGRVDVLVNSAEEISDSLLLDEGNTKDMLNIMHTIIIGTCLCTREAVKVMRKANVKGHIVNINSIFGHKINMSVPGVRPINGMFPACKYAVTAITECVRQELIYLQSDVKISSISPGLVDTDITTQATSNEMLTAMPKLQPRDVADALIYIITRPESVQIHDIILKPRGEFL